MGLGQRFQYIDLQQIKKTTRFLTEKIEWYSTIETSMHFLYIRSFKTITNK